jgi:hypothetical protein
MVKNLWKPVKHGQSFKIFEESESLDSNVSDECDSSDKDFLAVLWLNVLALLLFV